MIWVKELREYKNYQKYPHDIRKLIKMVAHHHPTPPDNKETFTIITTSWLFYKCERLAFLSHCTLIE